MAGPAQPVPTRFPCWVKAIYSWGGETKKDLGFIEGDLIECLNAGDGAWWTGRLRRDRRMVGLFPSNFVTVLDESFCPAPISRNSSPRTLTDSSPRKARSTFRKPFQAYEKLDGAASVTSSTGSTPDKLEKTKSRWAPYSSMKATQAPNSSGKQPTSSSPLKEEATFRIPSPPPRVVQRMKSRAHNHAAYQDSNQQTVVATRPRSATSHAHQPIDYTVDINDGSAEQTNFDDPSQAYAEYRVASPYDHQEHGHHDSRAPTPQRYKLDHGVDDNDAHDGNDQASSPPPAPPPHRVAYQPSRPPSPEHNGHENSTQGYLRTHSPLHSPGLTPSPLRDAMNDVMSSLHDMSGKGRAPSPTPPAPDPWSPDAFEQLRTNSSRPHSSRPDASPRRSRTQSGRPIHTFADCESIPSISPSVRDGPPQLSNYVQRMEHRLRHAKSAGLDMSRHQDDAGEEIPDTSATNSHAATDAPVPTLSQRQKSMLNRRSAYELGSARSSGINRTYTTKTSVTTSSSGWRSNATTSTDHTLSSVSSAGGVSATSAGSFARRRWGIGGSIRQKRPLSALSSRSQMEQGQEDHRIPQETRPSRPASPISGPSYHSSHATQPACTPVADWNNNPMENAGILGGLAGLAAPRAKKSGFFKKMIETAKTTARTGAANARSTISSSNTSRPASRAGGLAKRVGLPEGITSISSEQNSALASSAHRDMGLGGDSGWMQVRRDVNRSNSLSKNERNERAERCQMLDIAVLDPVDEFMDLAEGDESLDGLPITDPTDFNTSSLALVDKSTRFIASLPASLTPTVLAQSYLCRQYRSDVQRLRAIFTWVSERVAWEDDIEGQLDTRRVLQTKRGCTAEIANLVRDLCAAVGLHAEVVRGYLKAPGEALDLGMSSGPNHWWNAVIVDGEWRVMDCALAGPTNPKRSLYSSAGSNMAENWWFLARPMEVCYTHVPVLPEQQHICPPIAHEILMALPCACPPYFKHHVELTDFSTSALFLENLDMAHLRLVVPEDVECVAEVEAKAFAHDPDGDLFETGDIVKKAALAQAQWVGGRKVVTVKAVLPGDEGQAVVKIYAGKRGLMHSIKDNPHSLAAALPLTHTGQNPPFDFLIRHPTPHAQRHDLYVVQPQCHRLVINNTFVFCVVQHPSSLSRFSPDTWGSSNSALGMRPVSPGVNMTRPGSAMSMISASVSVSHSGSNYSNGSSGSSSQPGGAVNNGAMTDKQIKPAKLAIQSPGGKIIRLTRKQEYGGESRSRAAGDGRREVEKDREVLASTWETNIKVCERGTWRGLVLADRSARWCVFAEWECI